MKLWDRLLTFFAGVAVGVLLAALIPGIAPAPSERVIVKMNTIFQDRLVPAPVQPGDSCAAWIAEVNAWRTNDFRLWADAGLIYAQLYRRTAHARYDMRLLRHQMLIQCGADYAAIGYGYRLSETWTAGAGLAVLCGQARPYLLAAFSF